MLSISLARFSGNKGLSGKSYRVVSSNGDLDEEIFIAVPERHETLLSSRDEAIVPLGAILALVRGEDADFNGLEADPLLLRNVRAALRQYASWYSEFSVPNLSGLTPEKARAVPATQVAAFLSGGIDSQFSLLRHSAGNSTLPESALPSDLTHALHVFHTPEPVSPDAANALKALARTATDRDLKFVPVFSNLMTFDRSLNDRWADVGHGAGLATILHFLAGGIGAGVVGSTHSYGELMPWGSSPTTDPLWSSNRLRVVHDGSTFTRVEKTALIADNAAMLAGINVCDARVEGVGYVNCSQCQKCLRTMITLDFLGKANALACPSFDWTNYSSERFGNVFLRNANEVAFAREIRDAAEGKRPDIVNACNHAIIRSRRLRPLSTMELIVKKSAFGRRHRNRLKSARDNLYRSMGWAIKPQSS